MLLCCMNLAWDSRQHKSDCVKKGWELFTIQCALILCVSLVLFCAWVGVLLFPAPRGTALIHAETQPRWLKHSNIDIVVHVLVLAGACKLWCIMLWCIMLLHTPMSSYRPRGECMTSSIRALQATECIDISRLVSRIRLESKLLASQFIGSRGTWLNVDLPGAINIVKSKVLLKALKNLCADYVPTSADLYKALFWSKAATWFLSWKHAACWHATALSAISFNRGSPNSAKRGSPENLAVIATARLNSEMLRSTAWEACVQYPA